MEARPNMLPEAEVLTPHHKKRTDLSLADKCKILKRFDELNLKTKSQREAAAELRIPQSTLAGILKNRSKFENVAGSGRKRRRGGKSQTVDDALFIWYKQATSMNSPVSRKILLQKADDLAQQMGEVFTATDGWLNRWKDRHEIDFKKLRAEKQDCSVNSRESWVATTWKTILEVYAPENIYNLDETGLYYKATPDQCVYFENNVDSVSEEMKARVTIVLTCNMTGSVKRTPLVINKDKEPDCFKDVERLPVDYKYDADSWMTASIFKDYVQEWDTQLSKENKKIALILDNCPMHPNLTTLENIRLVFLPLNTMSIIQPLERGVIKTFKTYYRSEYKKKIIDLMVNKREAMLCAVNKITFLDAVSLIAKAWSMVSEKHILDCFSSLEKPAVQETVPVNFESPSDIDTRDSDRFPFSKWVEIDKDLPVAEIMCDADIVQCVMKNIFEEHNKGVVEEEPVRESLDKTKIREALSTIQRALEEYGGGKKEFSHFYSLESFLNKTDNKTNS